MALPNSRILIHQPAIESGYGQSSDLEIQAREIQRMRQAMEAVLAKHTGREEEQIRKDIERDKFLTAHEAKEYGLVDDVLTMLKRQPDVVTSSRACAIARRASNDGPEEATTAARRGTV